ncbi:hypothetical protein VTN00DRAFT_4547 [Thermoascus crustaceus]|uniref:uncharacterized protein n=1 Tax=Thermoascus crustaceus TaxID=5088 RepID=UPI0037429D32
MYKNPAACTDTYHNSIVILDAKQNSPSHAILGPISTPRLYCPPALPFFWLEPSLLQRVNPSGAPPATWPLENEGTRIVLSWTRYGMQSLENLYKTYNGKLNAPHHQQLGIVMTNTASRLDRDAVRRALEEARNSEDGHISPQTSAILENAIGELWNKIQRQPEYILSRDEFALFNYFRDRFRGSPIAQRAVERFWNNYQRNASDIDGYTT